jgi:hypothetical protein
MYTVYSYLTTLLQELRLQSTASNGRTISKWQIWKDLEGSGHVVILRYYPNIRLEGLRETAKNLSQDTLYPSLDLSQRPPEYEVGMLTTNFGQENVELKITEASGAYSYRMILKFIIIKTCLWTLSWIIKCNIHNLVLLFTHLRVCLSHDFSYRNFASTSLFSMHITWLYSFALIKSP